MSRPSGMTSGWLFLIAAMSFISSSIVFGGLLGSRPAFCITALSNQKPAGAWRPGKGDQLAVDLEAVDRRRLQLRHRRRRRYSRRAAPAFRSGQAGRCRCRRSRRRPAGCRNAPSARAGGRFRRRRCAWLFTWMPGFSFSKALITFSMPGRVAPSAAAQLAKVIVTLSCAPATDIDHAERARRWMSRARRPGLRW